MGGSLLGASPLYLYSTPVVIENGTIVTGNPSAVDELRAAGIPREHRSGQGRRTENYATTMAHLECAITHRPLWLNLMAVRSQRTVRILVTGEIANVTRAKNRILIALIAGVDDGSISRGTFRGAVR